MYLSNVYNNCLKSIYILKMQKWLGVLFTKCITYVNIICKYERRAEICCVWCRCLWISWWRLWDSRSRTLWNAFALMQKRSVMSHGSVTASLDSDARFDPRLSFVASSAFQRRAGVETVTLHRHAGDGQDPPLRIQRQIQLPGDTLLNIIITTILQGKLLKITFWIIIDLYKVI